ncbi:MAG: formylmethanofuran dehydrogenase [Oscillospiraceae bacterium]|nr:formylmethanofuran dehydrogenase [Oscillospiraceae bacterium]
MKDKKALWDRAVDFHGHACPGLTIGYRAALYAAELLELDFSEDEDVVCVSENDACGVDAIQAVLGCSIGKGNLLFHMAGKQAFSFYNRKSGKSVRLVLRPRSGEMTREEAFAFYQSCAQEEMFEVKEAAVRLPERARHFETYVCESCGEAAGANWIRLSGGKKLCIDCCRAYNRFDIS